MRAHLEDLLGAVDTPREEALYLILTLGLALSSVPDHTRRIILGPSYRALTLRGGSYLVLEP